MLRGVPNDPGTRCRMIKADSSRCGLTAAKSKNADLYCYQQYGRPAAPDLKSDQETP